MSDTYQANPTTMRKPTRMIQWSEQFAFRIGDPTPDEILEEGLGRGMHRCTQSMPCAPEQQERCVGLVRQAFTHPETFSTGRPWSARGATLFVELITIGTYARVVNNEPPLTTDQIKQYAFWSEEMSNSFFHF
jgi:hypothetical protein